VRGELVDEQLDLARRRAEPARVAVVANRGMLLELDLGQHADPVRLLEHPVPGQARGREDAVVCGDDVAAGEPFAEPEAAGELEDDLYVGTSLVRRLDDSPATLGPALACDHQDVALEEGRGR
jgi:hypothetical protein